jgi:thymidylate synthase
LFIVNFQKQHEEKKVKIYKPYENRLVDYQYQHALAQVKELGIRTPAQSGIDTITRMGIQMRFLVENGCPLITERNLAPERKRSPTIWRQAIAEITAFINGARTIKEIESYGCHWWKHFTSPEKCRKRGLAVNDNGPGSYGPGFHDFPMPNGKTCNQFAEVLKQMRELPHLKTHLISPWIPFYTYRGVDRVQKVVVCPCHGWVQFKIMNGKLTLHMTQRSADIPVGVPQNMVQYFALLLMVAQVLDLEPYEFIHYMVDAHFYSDQMEAVGALLSRSPQRFPTLTLDPTKKDLFEIRHTDFELSDYHPNREMKISVTP